MLENLSFYSIYKNKIYPMANALAILMELRFGIKLF